MAFRFRSVPADDVLPAPRTGGRSRRTLIVTDSGEHDVLAKRFLQFIALTILCVVAAVSYGLYMGPGANPGRTPRAVAARPATPPAPPPLAAPAPQPSALRPAALSPAPAVVPAPAPPPAAPARVEPLPAAEPAPAPAPPPAAATVPAPPPATAPVAPAPPPPAAVATVPAGPLDRAAIREVQRTLARLGFDPGGADGVAGRGTVRAIRAYQESRGITPTGELTAELAARLAAEPR